MVNEGTIIALGVGYCGFSVLAALRVIRRADASLCMAACFGCIAILRLIEGDVSAASFDSGIVLFCLYEWWRHRKDDDDNWRGKKFKAWAKSKIPRPVARVLHVPA